MWGGSSHSRGLRTDPDKPEDHLPPRVGALRPEGWRSELGTRLRGCSLGVPCGPRPGQKRTGLQLWGRDTDTCTYTHVPHKHTCTHTNTPTHHPHTHMLHDPPHTT